MSCVICISLIFHALVFLLCLQAAEAAVLGLSVSPGELKTETVEEFISISDGQVRGGEGGDAWGGGIVGPEGEGWRSSTTCLFWCSRCGHAGLQE